MEKYPSGGEGLGLHRLPFIGEFAYFYTISEFGFLWLIVGLSCVVAGSVSERPAVNIPIKLFLTAAYAALFFEFHKFEMTINSVLG